MATLDCTCAHCGKVSQGDSRRRYCSPKCGHLAQEARRPTGRQRRALRGPFICKHCGVEYSTRRPIGEGESYCGRQCSYAAQKVAGGTAAQADSLAKYRLVATEVAALCRIKAAWSDGDGHYSDCASCQKRFRRVNSARNCISCRLAAKVPSCRHCGIKYERVSKGSHHCSKECAAIAHALSKARGRKRQREKDAASGKLRAYRKKAKAIRRARRAIAAEVIDPISVFRRDHWRCHICGIKTPEKLRGTYDDAAPELDHLISLADGGSHTWANVSCACRRCNISKGAVSFGQLNLGWAA